LFSPDELLAQLNTYPKAHCLWVAYSGGLDSHVLLATLTRLRTQLIPMPQLRAIHVHHGLHSQADQWVIHCQQVCADLKVPLTVLRVMVSPQARESLEACAREARYAAFAAQLQADDIILTAHHADDQAETVLLQLLRGAGVAGLAAMPSLHPFASGWLARPLLNVTRAALQTYAEREQFTWIEDASNQDTRFDRNFLRHSIMPLLQQRWYGVNQVLGRAAHHQAEAQTLLNELAVQDLAHCHQTVHTAVQACSALAIPALKTLSSARQRNVLRYWLKQQQLNVPSAAQLAQILTQVIEAAADRQPLVQWTGAEVRRHQSCLVAMPNLPTIPLDTHLNWSDLAQPLPLPYGQLHASLQIAQGIDPQIITEPLQIRYRQGGEVWQWQGHRRSLKKCLQTVRLFPWHRALLPLIYHGDMLVAVPALGVHDAFQAKGQAHGWVVEWRLMPPYLSARVADRHAS